jgi:formylmethanofuran dehydrogenase subunit E
MADMNEKSSFELEKYLHLVQSFHGHVAPGVVIGGFMVHLARVRLPEDVLFKAICETPSCLPDAIQLLTSCTVGNDRLKIFNLGRYALSLYDREKGDGVRVFLLPQKIDENSEIKGWFFKLKPKSEQNMDLLLAQIKEAGATLCGIHPVQVRPELLKKEKRGEIVICPYCQEAYPAKDGEVCRGCQGQSPYIIPDTSEDPMLAFNALKSHGVY